LAVIQALRARGAEKIIVSEMAPRRKEFAKQFGAHYVLDPSKDDIVARVREICDGQGANVAFDAAGVYANLHLQFFLLRLYCEFSVMSQKILTLQPCLNRQDHTLERKR